MSKSLAVRNPRTGAYDYRFTLPDQAEVTRLAGSMRAAQVAWHNGGIEYRIAAMQQWKAALQQHHEALIAALTADTGRHAESVLEAELLQASIDRWCRMARDFFSEAATSRTSSIPFIQLTQQVVPYRLVAVISPWNFPLLLSVIDTIPALLAGCSVLVKPSEVTPRFIEVMEQTLLGVPALHQVFRYLAGDGSTGAMLVQQADLVCFTGSTATGKKVYASAAERMIPVFLELGGKDPAIVCAGAKLDQAASAILWGSCVNAGQSCLSIERVYVQRSVFQPFLDLLVQQAGRVRLSLDHPSSGQIGPIIFDKQADIINRQLANARELGATLHSGAWSCLEHGGGFYLPPTILTEVHHDMELMQQETFGPLIPVMPFDRVEEAVQWANGTVYGLSAAVFAEDEASAMQVAEQLECGAVSINDAALTAIMHEGEKNSFKLSGIGGTRMGPGAIRRFMRQKVMIRKDTSVPSPWWW